MYNRNNNVPFGNYNNQSSRGIGATRRNSNRLSIGGNVDPYGNHNSNPMHAGIQQHMTMYPRQPSMAAGLFSSYSSLSYVDENALPPLVKNNSSSSEDTISSEWAYNSTSEDRQSIAHTSYNDRSYASSFDPYYSPKQPRPTVNRRTSLSHATYRSARIDPFEYKLETPRTGHTTGTSSKEIEVAPGEFMRLRGAAETMDAIERDFFVPSDCVICQQTILCIADADFLLCPLCKTVSPLDATRNPSRFDCSVGLGFTPADLARWTSNDNRDSEQAAGRAAMLRTR